MKYTKGALDLEPAKKAFQHAFTELLRDSRKTTRELFDQQARGVIRNMYAVTPPMGGEKASFKYPDPGSKSKGPTVNFSIGKKQGKQTIETDMKKAFRVADANFRKKAKLNDEDRENILDFYLNNRSSRKRGRKLKILTTKSTIDYVRKHLLSRQGYVPAGWGSAAARFSVSGLPSWITRFHGKIASRCNVVYTADFMGFQAINGINARYSDQISRQVSIALNVQTRAIERWLKNYEEKLAARKLKGRS